MKLTGFVLPAATIGLGSLLLKPQRGFSIPPANGGSGPPQLITPQVTIEEIHHDEIVITEHPVEKGAVIADHIFKRPAEVVIRCAWSNSPNSDGGLLGAAVGIGASLTGTVGRIAAAAVPTFNAISSMLSGDAADQVKAIYAKLLALQTSGVLFDIYTGKRAYNNMLFRSLGVTTDAKYENSLMMTLVCRQVLVATTTITKNTVNNAALASQNNSDATDQGTVSAKPAPDVAVPA